MTTGKWKTAGTALVAAAFLLAVGCKKKEEKAPEPEKKAEPRPEPRKEPPRPDKPEPKKPEPPKMKWEQIKSEKYGIQFEIPAMLKQQTDEKDYLFAWDAAGTAFVAVGGVKKPKKAEKAIKKILKKLKIELVKFAGWKEVEHNGMKGKMTEGDFKTEKGAAVKGYAAVFTVAKKKHVAFLLLIRADKIKEYGPHVKKLQDSVKPLGAAKAPPAKGAEPAKGKEPAKKGKKPAKKKGK